MIQRAKELKSKYDFLSKKRFLFPTAAITGGMIAFIEEFIKDFIEFLQWNGVL